MALIALDIGGTKILAAAAARDGTFLRRARAETPLPLREGLALLLRLVREVAQDQPVEAIGISCGGPLDAENGIVSPLHQPEWRQLPLAAFLQKEFSCPIRIEVDTDAAALAEARFGGRTASRLLYLTVSTGMGGGLLVDGNIYRGHRGVHPEVGHQAIPYRLHGRSNGTELVACPCGATGCLEALISGTAIRKLYGKPAAELLPAEWEEVGHHLGIGLRNLAVIYAPEVIVLGGGVALNGAPFLLPTAEAVLRSGLRLVPVPRLEISRLGCDTPLQGALALAQNLLP